MYKIYAHHNKINNKYYIGITKRDLNIRWGKDGKGYIQQPKFYRAILKYGWDNFDHIILDYTNNEKIALAEESYYIHYYDSINNGYNILPKGIETAATICNSKPVYCATTNILYPSITAAAKELGNKSVSAIIENCKGKSSIAYDGDWYYWDVEKQQPIEKPLFQRKKPCTCVPVYCIELKKTFESIIEAERQLHLTHGSIMKVIHHNRNGAGNYHFVKESEKDYDHIKQALMLRTGKQRRVVCLEDNLVFMSIQDAAKKYKVSALSIMYNCQGKRKICKEHHFQYFEDYIQTCDTLEEIENIKYYKL